MEDLLKELGKRVAQKNITVCLVRHGSYIRDWLNPLYGHLTSDGIDEIKGLCKHLKSVAGEKQITLWTSPEKRAVESTEIISKNLKSENFTGTFVEKEIFGEITTYYTNIFDDCEYCDKGNFVIIVSHEPTIHSIGYQIVQKSFWVRSAETVVIYPDLSYKYIKNNSVL